MYVDKMSFEWRKPAMYSYFQYVIISSDCERVFAVIYITILSNYPVSFIPILVAYFQHQYYTILLETFGNEVMAIVKLRILMS